MRARFIFLFLLIAIIAVSLFAYDVLSLKSNGFVVKAIRSKSSSDLAVATSDVPREKFSAPVYAYSVESQSSYLELEPGEEGRLSLFLKNTGNISWKKDGDNPVYLATSRPNERTTVFYNKGQEGWISGDRISMKQDEVMSGEVAEFTFTVKAPKELGIYREYFRPVVEHIQWLHDAGVYWSITVNKDNNKAELKTYVSGKPDKYILIDISEQRLRAYENGRERFSFVTSTGMVGMDTPVGEFKIHNKYPSAYSEKYDLYMDNWMAITADGLYGLHSLPYWKLKSGGRLYEGEDHLGTRVSHGCIRTGIEQSKVLYDWAQVGYSVFVRE